MSFMLLQLCMRACVRVDVVDERGGVGRGGGRGTETYEGREKVKVRL